MDVRQFEIFLAVLDHSSVTRAAQKLGLSPGAVSLQLHGLANELRTDLFVHSGKRIVPTPQAFRLASHAREVTRRMREIRLEFENDPTNDTLPFRFATGATALIHRLGRPLRLLRTRFPHAEIHVTVAPTEGIVAGLLDRSFDLGLISLPWPERDLSILPLFEEELLLLKPSPGPVHDGAVHTLEPSALHGMPFLLYPRHSNMRTMIDRFFKDLGLSPRVIMEADDTEAIKRMVESGFGCSILPQFALRGRGSRFHKFRVAGHRLARTQALAMAHTEYPRALTQAVAAFLQTALKG
jgi:LysR family nitrogen assimilation transcriptional regulator